ncbi:hypothetical protein HGRIS_013635 [Hohenbuehelia grisea]|uniref:N-acetyltransferase domain-containing protein n=1 Tax=Hohenbuehelia grisea TaxID=104357 RepID=A0ABR3IW06_9AGAR
MIIASSDETQPLLPTEEQLKYDSPNDPQNHSATNPSRSTLPPIEPMRYRDAYRATQTLEAALENDPLQHYINETPGYTPPTSGEKRYKRWVNTVLNWTSIRRDTYLTIGRGESYILARPKSEPSGLVERILDFLYHGIGRVARLRSSRDSRRRIEEMKEKMGAAIERGVGERAKDMMHVMMLMTHPRHQGKGYGGGLLDFITASADTLGKSTFLESSNIANTAFYESHGFKTVSEAIIGDEEPTWKRPPVVVKIMVREFSPSS